MSENAIIVFGTQWCGDCHRVRKVFDRNNISYTWIDVDRDESAEEFVLSSNRGMRSVPTILFPDGSILVEPNEKQLRNLLETLLPSGK